MIFRTSIFTLVKELAPIGAHEVPPTLASGFGVDEPDPSKTPKQQVEDHVNTITKWFRRCNSREIMHQVHQVMDHPQFKEFQDSLSHKFGDEALNDLVNFDVWLKKKCISARIPSPPAPPASASAAVESASAESTTAEPAAPSPAEVAQYKNYWKQLAVTRGSPTPKSPSVPSPLPSSGTPVSTASEYVTPEAKKKDDAYEGLGFGIVNLSFCNYMILYIFIPLSLNALSRIQRREAQQVWLPRLT